MTLTVAATYENGVLRPERTLPLKENEKVEIVIHQIPPGRSDVSPTPPVDARMAALQRLLSLELPVADWDQMEEEITQGATPRRECGGATPSLRPSCRIMD